MPRDTEAEYRKRIERGFARGLTRSQARGHARAHEAPLRASANRGAPRFEAALKHLRAGVGLTDAARRANVAPEGFGRFLKAQGLAQREGRAWQVTDLRTRQLAMLTRGRERLVSVPGFEPASLIGKHWAAVRHLLTSNDPAPLASFVGVTVTDVKGRRLPFEVDPNVLYRIASTGGDGVENFYKIP